MKKSICMMVAATVGTMFLACGDDEDTTTTGTTNTTADGGNGEGGGDGGAGGVGGEGGAGGDMCTDPVDCVYCNQILSEGANPSDLCCDSVEIFNPLGDCTCVTECAMECGQGICAGNAMTNECSSCIETNCGSELDACLSDCPPEGCPGEGGAGGTGGSGGAGGA